MNGNRQKEMPRKQQRDGKPEGFSTTAKANLYTALLDQDRSKQFSPPEMSYLASLIAHDDPRIKQVASILTDDPGKTRKGFFRIFHKDRRDVVHTFRIIGYVLILLLCLCIGFLSFFVLQSY